MHSSAGKYFDIQSNFANSIIAYINNSLPFACVSVFAFMSGFLFFKGIHTADKKSLFISKLKTRLHSLLVPYLVWNILGLLFVILVTVIPFLNSMTSGFKLFDYTTESIFKGIFFHNYTNNWYIFFLMKYMLFSPLIYICLKNRKAALIFLAAAFIYSGIRIEGAPSVIISDSTYNIFFLYCLGGYISIHSFDWINKSYSKGVSVACAAGTILITLIYYFMSASNINKYVFGYIIELLRIVFIILMWISLDILASHAPKSWCKNSFFIYLAHGYILIVISKLFCIIYNHFNLNQFIGALLNITLVPLITVIIIEILAFILKKYFNKIWLFLIGGRS